MWLIAIPLTALAATIGATVYVRHKERSGITSSTSAAAAATSAGQSELRFLTDQALRLASQRPEFALTQAQREVAAQIAERYGMPQTATNIRAGGAWSNTEIWPGTGMSVASYLGGQWLVSPYNPNRGAAA